MPHADQQLAALAVIAFSALIATLYFIVLMCRTPLDRDGRPVRKKRAPRDDFTGHGLTWRPGGTHLRPAARHR